MSKEKTKVCKHCKEEIDAKAKVCPHCRKKQGGKLKWVIIIIIVLAVLGMAMGGGDDDSSSTDSSKSTTATTAAKKETAKKEETKEKDSVKVGESFENDGLKVTAKKAEFGYDGGEYFTPKDGCEYVASSAFLYGLYESDGDEWFLRCSNLTKIELANSVKQICLETDNYYDRTEKKQCNKMGDYLETIETLSMRDFNLQEITYKG